MSRSAIRREAVDFLVILILVILASRVSPFLAVGVGIVAVIYAPASKRRVLVMSTAILVVVAVAIALALLHGVGGASVTTGSLGPIPVP